MKRNANKNNTKNTLLWVLTAALVCMMALYGFTATGLFENKAANSAAYAEPAADTTTATTAAAVPASDPSPATYVAQKNANSVVGVITNVQQWDRSTGEVVEAAYSQGSGVVIAEGGYILTNYHVIQNGDSYKILMPDGTKVSAEVAGYDDSLELAVLKVSEDDAKQLTPVTIGSSENLTVGSTVVAIGNPGGEVLANTVTQGIVSALERSSMTSRNTTRNVDYIQHDAAINSGNSGGGLFDYQGNLVGINTLKYSGSVYSTTTFEGLGFAIPIDTAYPIAQQLIENGKVIRPQMGITVASYEGPDEPTKNYAPASVCIYGVNAGSPAEKAGLKQYDFIYSVNGERVTTYRELTALMDGYAAGDTVSVTVVRYSQVVPVTNNASGYYNSIFGNYFGGNYGYGSNGSNGSSGTDGSSGSSDGSTSGDSTTTQVTDLTVGGGYEMVTVDVTLELPTDAQ